MLQVNDLSNAEPIEQPDDWTARKKPGPRCIAHRKNGERCKNNPLRGSSVCKFHGGAARQVKEAARRRLDEAADKLMAELLEIAFDETHPVYVRLVAIRDGLDRAGYGAKHAIAVTAVDNKWDQITEDILIDVYRGDLRGEDGKSGTFVVDGEGEVTDDDESPPPPRNHDGRTETRRAEDGEVISFPSPNPQGDGATYGPIDLPRDGTEPDPGPSEYDDGRPTQTREQLLRDRLGIPDDE